MKRYAKFGYAAPFRFRVILEKPQGGAKMTPPPTRAKVKESAAVGSVTDREGKSSLYTDHQNKLHKSGILFGTCAVASAKG